ncbi:MAG: Ig-like domain-containing protein [Clostridia bacterium]|nr:Ig-like domain-containing protein [Clostridia bacterium]
MPYVNSVAVYPSSTTIEKGQWYYGAYASIASDCPECAEVEWYSTSPSIANVNTTTGYIYGVKTGKTRIYAEATDGSGKKDYITVTVTPPVAVAGVSVCPTSLTMNVGDLGYLCASITPYNATNQTVTWCSSDESVAEVNTYSGKITAKKAGVVTIVACTVDGGFAASCTVRVVIDTVIIQKDGAYNKVVFNKSGKVWRCINHDVIFDVHYMHDSTLIRRGNHNFYTSFDEDDPSKTDKTPKEYTDDEMKLLYAIDPYGVADYVQRYASKQFHVDDFEGVLGYKDRIFKILFNRKPKHFARTIDGVLCEVDDREKSNDVLSESEIFFGMHPIYEWRTFLEILEVCSLILNKVFLTNFFTSTIAETVISKIVRAGLLMVSGMGSLLRRELGSYVAGNAFEKAMEKTSLEWALSFVSLYDSLDDLANVMNLDLNYNKQIIDYCACQTGYNVLFELKDGTVHNLYNVCGMLG